MQANAVLLMAALAVHSTLDGVAVAVGDPTSGHAGPTMLLAVSLHKLPEGLALALLLLGAGYARRAALLLDLGDRGDHPGRAACSARWPCGGRLPPGWESCSPTSAAASCTWF